MVCDHFGPGDSRNSWELPGPWFDAMFDGGECPHCGEQILEGEKIRATGQGDYEHRECVDEEEDQDEDRLPFDPFDEIT